MGELLHRDWSVTVGTLKVAAPLRVSFEVKRTLTSKPNKATVRIWNITRDHQAEIERAAAAQVIVAAGYKGDRGAETIFSGELYRAAAGKAVQFGASSNLAATTEGSGVEVITTVQARDGGRAFNRARISTAWGEGVSISTVLRALATALGVGEGNLEEVAAAVSAVNGSTSFAEGTVVSGQVAHEMTRLLAGFGFTWSVQHGALQVLRRGAALQTRAVLLTPRTGLVGAPERGTRGHVKAMSLLTAGLWPGRHVQLESDRVSGLFKCAEVTNRGDSHGPQWHAELDLLPAEAA